MSLKNSQSDMNREPVMVAPIISRMAEKELIEEKDKMEMLKTSKNSSHVILIDLEDQGTTLKAFSNLIKKFNQDLQIQHLETRKSYSKTGCLQLFVEIGTTENNQVEQFVNEFNEGFKTQTAKIIPQTKPTDEIEEKLTQSMNCDLEKYPWFPKHISELDRVSNRVLMYGSELQADHPGFKDEVYRKRRLMFADIAFKYKYGEKIPHVEYTEVEKKTWKAVYTGLVGLYPTYACKEFNENFSLLQKHAGYMEDDLPQLNNVSEFLRSVTGFTLRPVAGYLSARDFLSGLAFRVFYCTQYIRHPSDPMYTPEPDCCHELLGHMAMLADPSFAEFSQELGLASLGTSDEEVKKLATCYFFSVEFGICRQNGQRRVFGAGLLSSISELKHSLSGKANIQQFEPERVKNQECLVTTFQEIYFETPSFDYAKDQMRQFAKNIERPFEVHYNPYTQRIDIIDSPKKLTGVIENVKSSLFTIETGLKKLGNNRYYEVNKKWFVSEE